jgi:membrane protease YdiL (CAAX protease family)
MTKFIRSLSASAEFCLVLLIGFGVSIVYEAWSIAHRYVVVMHDRTILASLVVELLELGIILWIGRIRGWSISTFGWRISWQWTAAGILLFFTVTTVKILVAIAAYSIHPRQPGFVVAGLTVPVIILLTLINPFFEELLEAGYFIHSLRGHGMWPVVLATSIFRGILHLYQGIDGATAIFAGGVLIGIAYWRWRQLWPLVIAHCLDDFLGLLYIRHFS